MFEKLNLNRLTENRTQLRRLLFTFLVAVMTKIYLRNSVLQEWPDVKKMLQVTMVLSIGCQVLTRVLLYLMETGQTVCLFETMKRFYAAYDDSDATRKNLLVLHMKRLKIVFLILMALHAMCEFLPFGMSLVNFISKGKTDPVLPAVLPFLDPQSKVSFLLNFIFQFLIAFLLYIGNPLLEGTYALFVTHSKACVDMIACDLNEFEDFLMTNEKVFDKNQKVIKEKLTNLIEKYLLEYSLNTTIIWINLLASNFSLSSQ